HSSARDSFLRAAPYYCNSEFFLHGDPRDPRITSAYQKSVECYKACAKLFDPPIEAVEIPYEHTTLPGYFHRVDHSDRKRPLLIIHSDSMVARPRKCMITARVPPSSVATTYWRSTGLDNSVHCIERVCTFGRIGKRSSPRLWILR